MLTSFKLFFVTFLHPFSSFSTLLEGQNGAHRHIKTHAKRSVISPQSEKPAGVGVILNSKGAERNERRDCCNMICKLVHSKNPGGPKNSTHGCFSKMGYPFKKKHRFSRDIPLKNHKFSH